ncbi:hypothetical protein Clacol_006649 [Clathrus columnatus]|uniref:Peptide N-acetyl-beta-D-glucosaminyl asparaginase amidase A N-terminal domain-containing protein n=1 Tax=Clathrus columnatus TaxID=1419009 RepID=A0AAV5ACM8_9AGAM|nr:hypothetical protein Clacol_006649 [Clathrus columnatus]
MVLVFIAPLVWRTSTPEPSDGLEITWTFLKDVTRYTPLFAKPGTLILDLNNLIEPSQGLVGEYDVTLSATFFAADNEHPPAKTADAIIPISNLSPNMANYVSVPPDFSLNQTFPINTVQAFAELYASGNGNEEFWYFNAADEFFGDLPPGFTFPDGPFREVRLLVDGQLAGVAYPYAVFFTGAIVPPAWRPITSYGALDLPTYYIDLTPFVPILADGDPHNLTLDVVSGESNHTINQNWDNFLRNALKKVRFRKRADPSGKQTTGKITKYEAGPFGTSSSSASIGNGDINITVEASRSLHIEAEVLSGSGQSTHVVWQQELKYTNTQFYLNNFNVQNLIQSSQGTSSSTHNGVTMVQDIFNFPVTIDLSGNATTTLCSFDHSYIRNLIPHPFMPGSTINERQLADASIIELPDGELAGGDSSNNNTFSYVDVKGNTFTRKVNASNNVILLDQQGGTLAAASQEKHGSLLNQLGWVAKLPGGRNKIKIN